MKIVKQPDLCTLSDLLDDIEELEQRLELAATSVDLLVWNISGEIRIGGDGAGGGGSVGTGASGDDDVPDSFH